MQGLHVGGKSSLFLTLLHACNASTKDGSGSSKLAEVPKLSQSMQFPAGQSSQIEKLLPGRAWRDASRKCILSALQPVTSKSEAVTACINDTDWFLTCLVHPSSLPRGPMRSTFAMPSDLSLHATPWISLAWELRRFQQQCGDCAAVDAALLRWARETSRQQAHTLGSEDMSLDHRFVFSPLLGAGRRAPDDVVVAGTICLVGAVLRSGGRAAAGQFMEMVFSSH